VPRRLWSVLAAITAVGLAAATLVLFPGIAGWHVYKVPSGSMERTLPLRSYIATEPADAAKRGSIIVYRAPVSPLAPRVTGPFVKRVIAVGGDTIECCDPSGAVVVDGHPLSEPYVFEDDKQRFGPVIVPPHRLFVMGDHRAFSADSRVNISDRYHGTIAEGAVIGAAIGPLSQSAAHREPVRHYLPHLLALGLIVGAGTELITRRMRVRLPEPASSTTG
jgi:signal peptidase I